MPDNNRILGLYKEQYENPVMNDKAVFEMKQRIEQGKKEKRSMSKKKVYKVLAIAASVVLAIVILPNTSKTLAYAMEDIPILGEFFKVITFRDYTYEDEKNAADVVVPEVTTEKNVDKAVAETGKRQLMRSMRRSGILQISGWMNLNQIWKMWATMILRLIMKL